MPTILNTPEIVINAQCNGAGLTLTIQRLPNGTVNTTIFDCGHSEVNKLFTWLFHLRAPSGNPDYLPLGNFSMRHHHSGAPDEKVTETFEYSEHVEANPNGTDYSFTYRSKFEDHSTTPPTPITDMECSVNLTRNQVTTAATALSNALENCCQNVQLISKEKSKK